MFIESDCCFLSLLLDILVKFCQFHVVTIAGNENPISSDGESNLHFF